MSYSPALHYLAAFAIVLVGTAALAAIGAFEGMPETGITTLAVAELHSEGNNTNQTITTPERPKPTQPGPGSW